LSRRIRGRKGLAQVITTLMLLVVSVLLSGVAIYYSVNMVQVRMQTEEVRLVKEKVWVNSTGAVAAFKVQNLGGRDILIDKIQVRGPSRYSGKRGFECHKLYDSNGLTNY